MKWFVTPCKATPTAGRCESMASCVHKGCSKQKSWSQEGSPSQDTGNPAGQQRSSPQEQLRATSGCSRDTLCRDWSLQLGNMGEKSQGRLGMEEDRKVCRNRAGLRLEVSKCPLSGVIMMLLGEGLIHKATVGSHSRPQNRS